MPGLLAQVPPTAPPLPPTIRIELPSEIVEKLGPVAPSWPSQPVATLIAAGVALAAAGIAWLSVLRQVKANAANLEKQLAAQAEQFAKTEEFRQQDGRRKQVSKVLARLNSSFQRASRAVIDLSNIRRASLGEATGNQGPVPDWRTGYQAAELDLAAVAVSIWMLELGNVAIAHARYMAAADAYVRLGEQTSEAEAAAYEEYQRKSSELIAAMLSALENDEDERRAWRERHKSPPPVGPQPVDPAESGPVENQSGS